jgi:hypothetical protein
MSILNFFKDKYGKYVVAQRPNKPLLIAIALYALRFIPNAAAQQFSHWSVSIVLIYWSFLEIKSGESLWRRFLGCIVMLMSIKNILERIAPFINT